LTCSTAARAGSELIVKFLIGKGANVNCKNKYLLIANNLMVRNNETPLHIAARTGRASMVELLVQNKADCRIRSAIGTARFEIFAN
jgi:ankyrin repeat protein